MLVEKLSPTSRQVIFTAKRKAEKETLGLPTFAHLLSSFASQKDDVTARVWKSLSLKIDRATLYQTVPLPEILKEAVSEAAKSASETVETSHLFISTLIALRLPEAVLAEARNRFLWHSRYDTSAAPKKSVLENFAIDLSKSATPVLVRSEVSQAFRILLRKEKRSLCLTGERGVGKTSLVSALAAMCLTKKASKVGLAAENHKSITHDLITDKKTSDALKILQFDSNAFQSEDLQNSEQVFRTILEEASAAPQTVLFFDDFSTFLTPSMAFHGIMPLLKSYLESGRLRVIIAYNDSDFSRMFEQDDFFTKCFTTINLNEPTERETTQILEIHRPLLENFHAVRIGREVTAAVITLAEFANSAPAPEKTLDLLDLACVEAKLRGSQDSVVTTADVEAVASKISGVPLTSSALEKKDLLCLGKVLSAEIIGQAEAVNQLVRALSKARLGLTDRARPWGSFLFLGPTGVGKTELVRSLCRHLFAQNSSSHLIKIDMSEFRERHTVSRLIGAPPGYVGFGQGGELTEKVMRHPFSVILVDEMEKAAPEVLNIFLQIMDEGVLTDGEGNRVDFRSTIVIFTSNVGSELIKKGDLGFTVNARSIDAAETSRSREVAPDHSTGRTPEVPKRGPLSRGPLTETAAVSSTRENDDLGLKERLLVELKNSFRPEFLNRLDAVTVFRMLGKEDVRKIARIELGKVARRFKEQGIGLRADRSAANFLAREGFSPEYGVRFLKRTIEEKVVDTLTSYLLSGRLRAKDVVKVTSGPKGLQFKITHR